MTQTQKQKDIEILIAEDEEIIAKLYQVHLRELGNIHFTVATTGLQGINHLLESNYDLVITDQKMPETTGSELIKIFRTLTINDYVPIIMVSGFLTKEVIVEVEAYGNVHTMTKPIKKQEFVSLVRRLLEEKLGRTLKVKSKSLPKGA